MAPLIEVRDLTKTYTLGEVEVRALQGVTLTIERGSFVAVMGASGSGKSTLMNMLGCLDRPTSGSYRLDGAPVESLSRDQLAEIRNQKIGFVFQSFNLFPAFTIEENVAWPLRFLGVRWHAACRKAAAALWASCAGCDPRHCVLHRLLPRGAGIKRRRASRRGAASLRSNRDRAGRRFAYGCAPRRDRCRMSAGTRRHSR